MAEVKGWVKFPSAKKEQNEETYGKIDVDGVKDGRPQNFMLSAPNISLTGLEILRILTQKCLLTMTGARNSYIKGHQLPGK